MALSLGCFEKPGTGVPCFYLKRFARLDAEERFIPPIEGELTSLIPGDSLHDDICCDQPSVRSVSERSNFVQIPISVFASANLTMANSRSSSVCAAEICVRILALPLGTTGKEKPMT